MVQITSSNGNEIRDMFAAGSGWLEKSVSDVNAINVFPVPDGDTGTNMFLTVRSTMEEADRAIDASVSEVIKAMAQGALMGARGNSGVILSQIFRGMAKTLEGKETITGNDWAEALAEAARSAYKGLSKPVEGTILTVMHDASVAAEGAAKENPHSMVDVTEAAVKAAKDSVANTPMLLPVLREAGVVDAGGMGLYVLFEGMLRYLKGEAEDMLNNKPAMIVADIPAGEGIAGPIISGEDEEIPYGYCTNFLLEGLKLNADKIRNRLEDRGQSLVVVGDSTTVRVHIHTYDPGAVLRYATSLGTLHQIQIQNMDDQHIGFKEMQKEAAPKVNIAVVAVVAGNGMKEVFQSLGTNAIVSGGQTMNPSVRDIVHAVEGVNSDQIVILPNNKNIVLTASQVHELTPKKVAVIPSKTLPQGVAALLAFNYEGEFDENIEAMEDAITKVTTIEITRAVRSTKINNLNVVEGQAIAIVDDDNLVAAGDKDTEVLFDALDKTSIKKAEVITTYYGEGVSESEAEDVAKWIRNKYPGKEVEVVNGGQPHYSYTVSLE
jgi:DAK2 domain fusion protein YloV